jgi:uncharacterized membrane protein YjjP (DUF1212 family)
MNNCEKCQKINRLKDETINNWIIFIYSCFVMYIIYSLNYLPFSNYFFFGIICFSLLVFYRFIRITNKNKNKVYIKGCSSCSINGKEKGGE